MDIDVPTSVGPGRLVVAAAAEPRAALWLGHGAGGGIGATDLTALAERLPERGVTVLRYEQPWRVAGRRVAARPPQLDAAWLETAAAVREAVGDLPLIVSGRSAGARVACRTATEVGAVGVVCLAFPLHPPGRPEKSRLEELLTPDVPVLVLQGDRDTFGTAEQLRVETAEGGGAGVGGAVRVVTVPGADHSMKVLASSPLRPAEVARLIVDEVAGFIADVGRPGPAVDA